MNRAGRATRWVAALDRNTMWFGFTLGLLLASIAIRHGVSPTAAFFIPVGGQIAVSMGVDLFDAVRKPNRAARLRLTLRRLSRSPASVLCALVGATALIIIVLGWLT